ncbi:MULTISPECIES: hypothetical protein [Pseudomonas]|uniref:hypothetical protein n=1 Tax=Pseudomonas TaxID=286 RepID=UPI0018E7735B|nr:hypothetical protein [Pseudomonas carnis]MBP5947835.1 hypothetical protein [Pseudomonas sp. P9(2020)]
MKIKPVLGLGFVVALSGCTSAWIANPSPQTEALVSDLRLEGFECKAHMSSVECVQKEPWRNKQPSKCDSANGCVEQPDHLVYNRYVIKQQDTGIPSIEHDLIQLKDSKFIKTKVSDGI